MQTDRLRITAVLGKINISFSDGAGKCNFTAYVTPEVLAEALGQGMNLKDPLCKLRDDGSWTLHDGAKEAA
jgi:hypothetical protein